MRKNLSRINKVITFRRCCKVGLWIALRLIRLLPVSLEVFFRHTFGQRYGWDFLFSFVLFYIYKSIAQYFSAGASSILLDVFFWAFGSLASYHQVSMWARRRGNIQVHSRSTGLSWNIWEQLRFNPQIVQRYFEPALAFLFGGLIVHSSFALALWIKVSAVSLFIKGQLQRFTLQARLWDTMDSKIEAEQLHSTIAERNGPRQETFEATQAVSNPRANDA